VKALASGLTPGSASSACTPVFAGAGFDGADRIRTRRAGAPACLHQSGAERSNAVRRFRRSRAAIQGRQPEIDRNYLIDKIIMDSAARSSSRLGASALARFWLAAMQCEG
jgi:hypothetical protein